VNLALEVLGRRADGYHEIVTVMQGVELSDRVVLEDVETLELRTTAPGIPTDASNLALRAAMTPLRATRAAHRIASPPAMTVPGRNQLCAARPATRATIKTATASHP